MKVPEWCLLDTNVPILANGAKVAELTDLSDRCVDVVQIITARGGLVMDEGDRIFDEYRDNLRLAGQPGLGDMFMKWVHDNRWNPEYCKRVPVTCSDENNQVFDEFPVSSDLQDFDDDDRKFVAVANAHPDKPAILEAVDYKWWGWKDALASVGIRVQFLDPALAKRKYQEHLGHA